MILLIPIYFRNKVLKIKFYSHTLHEKPYKKLEGQRVLSKSIYQILAVGHFHHKMLELLLDCIVREFIRQWVEKINRSDQNSTIVLR